MFSDDAEFPCCSCECLFLRKQVTAFKFSDPKISPEKSKFLKYYRAIPVLLHRCITYVNTVGQFWTKTKCRQNVSSMVCLRSLCLNSLPLRYKGEKHSKKLGTHTGKVPTYNSHKACKGTMFFLPLPLDKTLQNIEDVENGKIIDSVLHRSQW